MPPDREWQKQLESKAVIPKVSRLTEGFYKQNGVVSTSSMQIQGSAVLLTRLVRGFSNYSVMGN